MRRVTETRVAGRSVRASGVGLLVAAVLVTSIGYARAATTTLWASSVPGVAAWQNESNATGPGCTASCACSDTDSTLNPDPPDDAWLEAREFDQLVLPPGHHITSVRVNVLARYSAGSLPTSSRIRLYVDNPPYCPYNDDRAPPCSKTVHESAQWSSDSSSCQWRAWSNPGGTDLELVNLHGVPGNVWSADAVNNLRIGFRAAGNNTSNFYVKAVRLVVTHFECGNGVGEPGEQCDLGSSNGAGTCCTTSCQFSTGVCRPSVGACDLPDLCVFGELACPSDARQTAGYECTTSRGPCDPVEVCDGVGVACPADVMFAAGHACPSPLGGAGLCSGSPDAFCYLPEDFDEACPDACADGQLDPHETDDDGDGIANACDPCTSALANAIADAKVTIKHPGPPAGDDRITFSGEMTVPTFPMIDPVANGLRVLVAAADGSHPLDVLVPPGAYSATTRAGWKANGSATSWSYGNSGRLVPLVEGIISARVKLTPKRPGLLKFKIAGKLGSYPVPPTGIPLAATVVVDTQSPGTNQCGEARFPGLGNPEGSCAFNASRTSLRCK